MTVSIQEPTDFITSLTGQLNGIKDRKKLYQEIVDAPFVTRIQAAHYFLGIVVLLLVDRESGLIERIALSNTDFAKRTKDVSMVPFTQIKIPRDDDVNIIAKAIRTGKPFSTTDWRVLFHPAMSASDARINQANSGIAYSQVHPFTAAGSGALIHSYYQYPSDIGEAQRYFMKAYTKLVNDCLEQLAPDALS